MSPAEDVGLELIDVTAGYGGPPAVRGISVAARAGEVTAVVGPNGSGKTTLVRVASRALRPTAGAVRVGSIDPYAIPARRAARLVAVVPQAVAPVFSYTALEIVLMGRAPYQGAFGGGSATDWQRVRWSMAVTNTQHLADRPIEELSGGERQRVVLAQALAQDTPVLLLDEPTTHLDLRHVVEILGVARTLARDDRRTVLAILHDLNLAAAFADRVVVLDGGAAVAAGPPSSVLTTEVVRDVFGVEVETASVAGRPAFVLSPPSPDRPAVRGRAHVFGGAGTGASAMRALAEAGFDVSVGAVHAGDTDALLAERLNLRRVVVPPFSEIDEDAERETAALARNARVALVCDPPFGRGNVANLRAALAAAMAGVPTVVLERTPIDDRDFTGGEAARIWNEVRARGTVVASVGDLLSFAAGGGS